ncbi:glycosyltransferase [Flavobacterium sp. Root420]|uniref:glycosyltransferase n=1 Tax=Flavobacterium sp. Root420 TaxID=1736533 RepID=UPI0006F7CFAC|nr:glycosyltransferase [Flavobacterium sp. Root420]KQW97721.1 glycosyl transferase [Flavobacterium sp. Root420]
MKFAIITHVNHIKNNDQYFGYAPYVREMNIWLEYVDEVIVVGPLLHGNPGVIDIAYSHNKIDFRKVPDFSFTSFKSNIVSFIKLPIIFWKIFWAMNDADHIHLRCPGNVGLIGSLVQILFPGKIKTAKYAGNWDPKSNQPWTYKLQKKILNNSFLTRNMKVLVYGDWENQSKNMKSFFTATYSESEKLLPNKTDFENSVEFIFVGTLVSGKNPMYAIKLVEQCIKQNKNVILNLYGEGSERVALEEYIKKNKLENYIFLNGNQNQETIKKAYQKSHFVILPSKSEGWPKAIAEGMFWGCVSIATKVSCVPFMLDYGKRGILLEMDLEKDVFQIENVVKGKGDFLSKSKLAASWSQQYTTEVFESEIKKLLVK